MDNAAPVAISHRWALIFEIGAGFNVSTVIGVQGRLMCPAAKASHASLPSRVTRVIDDMTLGMGNAFDAVESLFAGQLRHRLLSEVTSQTVESANPSIAALGRLWNEANDAGLDAYAQLIGHLLLDLKLTYMRATAPF